MDVRKEINKMFFCLKNKEPYYGLYYDFEEEKKIYDTIYKIFETIDDYEEKKNKESEEL